MAAWEPGLGVEITVRMSGAGPYDNPDDWAKTDITGYVRKTEGITISRGRSDEFSDFQTGTCSFTVNNNGREFDPSYVASPYAAFLKPRAHVEVVTSRAGTNLNLSGASGTYASTPDHTSLDITGDLDIRVDVVATDWTPTASQTLVAKWVVAGNQQSYLFQITSTGLLRLITSPDGTQGNAILKDSTVAVSPPGDGRLAVRVTLDVNDGAGGRVTKFYTGPSRTGPWTQLGATDTTAGTTSIFNSTAPLEVGSNSAGTVERFIGQIYYVEVRNGIDGTVVANPDFFVQVGSGTSFRDDQGRTWTLNGGAAFGLLGGTEIKLFTGYVEGWPQEWSKTTGTVQVTAQDRLSILANDATTIALGSFVLGDPVQGVLGTGVLGSPLSNQLSGERILALLSVGGYSGDFVDADIGLTVITPVGTEGNILNLIQEAVNAEAGFFFVNRDGHFIFFDRHSRFLEHRLATVQAVFTDSHYADLHVDRNLTQVWNDVRIERVAPDSNLLVNLTGEEGDTPVETDAEVIVPQRAADGPSIRANGRRVHTASIPVDSDADALGRAQFWLRRFAQPKDRPGEIQVPLRRDLRVTYNRCIERELLDRVQIVRTPLGISPATTFTGLVERIEHQITNVDWRSTFEVSLIDIEEGSTFMRLGDATLGKLGTGELAY